MNWNAKALKQQGFKLTFQRGIRSWFYLVLICFVFSYAGNARGIAGTFVNTLDSSLGLGLTVDSSNVDRLKQYVAEEIRDGRPAPVLVQVIERGIDLVAQDLLWLVNLLAINGAYFKRNATEVIGYLFLAAAVSMLFRSFIQNILIIGKLRYVMEHRFQKYTLFRRCLAPFHKKIILNLIWVMFCYNLCITLWSLTIIGGFYKAFQYRMIPYLLAENPNLSRKEAFRLSREMTYGYKWKMFCMELSLWYVWLLHYISPLGLLIALPYESATRAEIYFLLRAEKKERMPEENCFIEAAFDGEAWNGTSKTLQLEVPSFLLQDIVADNGVENEKKHQYQWTDFVLIFFLFSLVGWIWEVGLHLVQTQELVNRGTMHGPWLPIYGTGSVLCILLLNRGKKNQYRTFGLIILVAGILEYFTSWFLDFFYNSHYWEYHDKFANLNGRICLEGLLIFGFGGVFVLYIAGPYLAEHFHRIDKKIRVLLSVLLCSLFLVDLVCCFLFGFNSGKGVGALY